MLYLALGAAALAIYVLASSGKPVFKRSEWRLASGAFALAAFTAAAYVGVRGEWWIALALVMLGLWLAVSARRTGMAAGPSRGGRMSLDEARSILGVTPEATPEEIQAAYTRLMRMAHPDKGGTTGLASQLNAARDRLLRS
ncbi:MAG: dnaJ-class molecular chaperone [Phenylobacterium sp.]|jgi:DnaJ-domain-containing protein 1|nr:dnaJ-class molecular chaperone [Phenylobacterium sp.]